MKRAKSGTLKYIECKTYYNEYEYPHCRRLFIGDNYSENVLCFLCYGCNEEIIIKKRVWINKKN
jgi:hypothetical protein